MHPARRKSLGYELLIFISINIIIIIIFWPTCTTCLYIMIKNIYAKNTYTHIHPYAKL